MNNLNSWESAKNILCVRLDNAGDLLMTVPALRALKAAVPGRRMTLLCSTAGSRIRGLIPEIDDMVVYDAPWVQTPPASSAPRDMRVVEDLALRLFDGAVIFTVYSQNPLAAAFLCYIAGIPLRTAFCRENPYRLLTHWAPEQEPAREVRHEVARQLALAAAAGAGPVTDDHIRIRIPAAAAARADILLSEMGIGRDDTWMMLHPGASAPSRRYPADLFSAVCDLIAGRGVIVFTGSAAESPLIESIRASTRADTRSLAGRTDAETLAALVRRAPLLVSNNTLPVHLASATGTPVVDLYALTNPQHTPWKTTHRVLFVDVPCKNCYRSVCPRGTNDCLRLVRPESVAEAALELLGERRCILSE